MLNNADSTRLNSSVSVDTSDKNIQTYLQYLHDLQEPAKFLSDKSVFDVISNLFNLIEYNNVIRQKVYLMIMDQYESLFDIFTNLFAFYYENLKQLVRNFDSFDSLMYASKYDLILKLLNFCLSMTNSYQEFQNRLHLSKCTKIFLFFLNDNEIIVKFSDIFYSYSISLEYIYIAIIENLLNLSKIGDSYRKDFKELGVYDSALRCLSRYKHDFRVSTILYMILINIVNDDEISELQDIRIAIEYLTKHVSLCKNSLETDEFEMVKRMQIDIETENGERKLVNVCYNEHGFNLNELLTCLVRVAVNDKIKIDIYENYNFKQYLEVIIFKGNSFEKSCAAKLLWQLCFANDIANSVNNNIQLFEYIQNLADTETNFPDLRRHCQGILWVIKKNCVEKKRENRIMMRAEIKRVPANHIMISYNSESRDTCLKIKQELEKQNHKVWIDVENIHGSSLEAMANAVEESKCVLIFATEKYKQSPNCRAEAEYTFKLNKPFIPLIMQQKYSPDGWLGIIFGSKIYINFTKYDFNVAFERLLNEINVTLKGGYGDEDDNDKTIVVPIKQPLLKPVIIQYDPIDNWSPEDIQGWLKFSKVDPQIMHILRDCNGSLLKKLKNTLVSLFSELETSPPAPCPSTQANPDNWSKEDVKKWLKETKTDCQIVEILKDFNGHQLKRLGTVRKEAPDYFYQSISQNNKIDLLSVLNFTEEFEKLKFF